jgi:hypothetical protein
LASADLNGSRVVSLLLGFGFIPLTEELVLDDEPTPFEHLLRFSARLGARAEIQSKKFPLAYIETDYFGGHGCQAATAWIGGDAAFGPAHAADLWEGSKYVPTPLLEGAINRTVRLIGVDRGAALDEFDALGLGRHRSNESWLSGGEAG